MLAEHRPPEKCKFKRYKGTPERLAANAAATEEARLIEPYAKANERWLDAGCGSGRFSFLLSYSWDCFVWGVDKGAFWPDERPGLVGFSIGDFSRLLFMDGFFDNIIAFGSLEHDERGIEPYLRELYRVLKPGGRLFVTVPLERPIDDGGEGEFWQWRFKPLDLRIGLQQARFCVDDLWLIQHAQGAWAWGRSRLWRLFVRAFLPKQWVCHMIFAIARKQ